MWKKRIKLKLISGAFAVLIIIVAAASVIGPVKSFSDKCSEFFSFGMGDRIKQIKQFYDSYLANAGLTAEDLENLPFDDEIIGQAISYDLNGGNVKYKDGLDLCYRSYETKTDTVTTTTTVETTYKHFDGSARPKEVNLKNAGCDNYSVEDFVTPKGKILKRYVCNGHTITQEIVNQEERTRYLTYGHYFTIKSSEYLAGYDIPWNVILALAVVQKYAYNGTLELDDYVGDEEEFKYQLTKKGIKKIHDMFSTEEGVKTDEIYSYMPYAVSQKKVKQMEAIGKSKEEIENSLEYKSSILDESEVLTKGTYYYESADSGHPSLAIAVTDIYSYIWHYHYEYDCSTGMPVFVSGSRTSRVAFFLDTLEKNQFDESAADLLVALVDAMPDGEETAATLEFLFGYYDENGTEYTESLDDGVVYRMKQTGCYIIEETNNS